MVDEVISDRRGQTPCQPGGPAGADRPKPPRRILVVDDNRDGAASLALLLKIYGHEARTAHDGLEAVTSADHFRPEVVLMDLGLPKLDGFEAARRIRERTWSEGIVLIALTGRDGEEDRRRSLAAGFDHHLVKPVDVAALTKLLAASAAAND
jgi:CheY-like chemotaxis protein